MVHQLKKDLQKLGNKEKAKLLSRFFKTGKGQYGEGDVFLGITVPEQRRIAKRYSGLTSGDLKVLISSTIHEHRLTSLLILIIKYRQANPSEKRTIFYFYLKNRKNINNWDLVDLSAGHIIGNYLLEKERSLLYKLAGSKNVWDRRIAIIATSVFIKNNDFHDTLQIAEQLINDRHDLIHKAAGWMLREVGKRSLPTEETFLKRHCRKMPRTMLRYAIERFPEEKRQGYLKGIM
jgi:3-methyladenine DNA glycosylase AlkD